MSDNSGKYTRYTADGTYWTGRKSQKGNLEVVRLDEDYVQVESLGFYSRQGSAVGAAAKLAYAQGYSDAKAELSTSVLAALQGLGIGAVTIEQADIDDDIAGEDAV